MRTHSKVTFSYLDIRMDFDKSHIADPTNFF